MSERVESMASFQIASLSQDLNFPSSSDMGPDLNPWSAASAVSNESRSVCIDKDPGGSLESQPTSGVMKQDRVWWWTPPSVPVCHMTVRKFSMFLIA